MKIPRHKIYIPFLKIFKSLFLILIDFNNKPGNFNIKLLEKIKLFFNVKYSLTVSTWRIGFFYALRALEFQKNDEILISAISIPDQINCIEILGLKPIFVDLDEETHGMCIEDLKKKISEKTKAIHITYLSGIIPDLDPIISLAKDNNLKIIEDISQAYGATYNNKIVGTIGDIGIGSMSLGKTVASLYGGMIITNSQDLFSKISEFSKNELKAPSKILLLRSAIFQIFVSILTSKYIFSLLMFNIFKIIKFLSPNTLKDPELKNKFFKLTSDKNNFFDNPQILRQEFPTNIFFYLNNIQAELAYITLSDLEKNIEIMRSQAQKYFNNLNPIIKEKIPKFASNYDVNTYWHLPIKTDQIKIDLREFFFKNGIDSVGYGLPTCNTIFEKYKDINLPKTEKIKNLTIFLPLNAKFSSDTINYSIKILNRIN